MSHERTSAVKRHRMPGTAETVIPLVIEELGGPNVLAAYEAGYSGFSIPKVVAA